MNYNEAFENFLIYLEAKGNSPRTIQTYEQRLRWFQECVQEINLEKITPEIIDKWVVGMRKRLAPSSVNSRIRDVKHFFRWCKQRDYINSMPAKHLIMRRDQSLTVKAMAKADLISMLAIATEPRDIAVIRFLASTGCRAGEAANLRISNLNLNDLEALIEGKTGQRFVDFDQRTADVLSVWLDVHPRTQCDHVFVGLPAPHNPTRGTTIYMICKRLAKRAGVKGRFNPHSIRHLVGQTWADNVNLELVRKKLGHADITSTLVYANQDRERVKTMTKTLTLI